MSIQNKNYEQDVLNALNESVYLSDEYNSTIDLKINELMKCKFSQKMSPDFIQVCESKLKQEACWILFKQMNNYLNANKDEKDNLFQQIKKTMLISNRAEVLKNRGFIQGLFTCEDSKLIALFCEIFPKPPTSIFDKDKAPQFLIEEEENKAKIVDEFKQRNKNTEYLENKVMYIQRHIRAELRKRSEIERISWLYFNSYSKEEAEKKAFEVLENANIPYRPKKCSPALADRIMRAADQVTLHTTVNHLTATANVGKIIDGTLLGRENLVNAYVHFRPAALSTFDCIQGDGNVVCFGPDLVDVICLKEGTIGLEFDLKSILDDKNYNKNPNIFFKQRDLGYTPDLGVVQKIKIKNEVVEFKLKGGDISKHDTCLSVVLNKNRALSYILPGGMPCYDGNRLSELEFSANIPNCNLIYYNTKEMQKIWTLKFFQFIDNLKSRSDDYYEKDALPQFIVENKDKMPEVVANLFRSLVEYKYPKYNSVEKEIHYFYDLVNQLSDEELVAFLTDVGKKMSCSSEFNFSGAYKIDLNALIRLNFLKPRTGEDARLTRPQANDTSIEMKQLIDELNTGSYDLLNKLKKLAPELLKSTRFVDFLLLKVSDPHNLDKVKEYISMD